MNSRAWQRPVGAAVGLVLAANTHEALAQTETPGRSNLSYAAPDGCPSEAELRAQLEAAEVHLPAESEVAVTLRPGPAGFSLLVELRSQGRVGRRALSHSDCSALVAAAVALLGLAANEEEGAESLLTPSPPSPPASVEGTGRSDPLGTLPNAAGGAPPGAAASPLGVPQPPATASAGPAPAPPSAAPSDQQPSRAPAPPSAQQASDSPRFPRAAFMGLQAHLASGTLPAQATGFGAYGGVQLGIFRLGVGGSWWPSVKSDTGDAPGIEASQLSVQLEPCLLQYWGGFRVGGCGTLSGHWLSATALNISAASSDTAGWWSAGPSVLFGYGLGLELSVELTLGLQFPFRSPELRYFSEENETHTVLFSPGNWARDGRLALLFNF